MAKGRKIIFFLLIVFLWCQECDISPYSARLFHSFPYSSWSFQLFCAQVDRGGMLGTSAMHTATVAKSLAVPFASPVTIGDSDLM